MRCLLLTALLATLAGSLPAEELGILEKVEPQPFIAATQRLQEALRFIGTPLPAGDAAALAAAAKETEGAKAVVAIQKVLDKHCLMAVNINPESRVSVVEGPAAPTLHQHGWRTFLVKVHNEAGVTAPLKVSSPNAAPIYFLGKGARQTAEGTPPVSEVELRERFLDVASYDKPPFKPGLSGLNLEYRVLQIYSRDAGKREAKLEFDVGQGTQDLGFRNEISVLFQSERAVPVTWIIHDETGKPTTAALVIKDSQGRVYPNPARRLAPDFFFHDQIYRVSGEDVLLPPGEYVVTIARGPEYLPQRRNVTVSGSPQEVSVKLERWIHPAARNWFSGDHHVHAAGCKHYDSPTEGVRPEDMLRHIVGEDLNVGCVLTWGPCWYFQKRYFEGKTSALSQPNYLMRYDIEISGFPSSHAGHLCLLRLTEDDYPGTQRIEQWPSWTMPVLQWGQQQDGVVGYSHSGWGLTMPDYNDKGDRVPNRQGRAADKLPDYAMPPFDGIGANEFIVTVAHDACDFISAVDTPIVWELNIWYHTLNCGFRSRISGETDFPCIYGDKVGLGRIYVKMPPGQPLEFDEWMQGVKEGRSYCGDGMSHILDFKVNDVPVGEPGSEKKISQLNLDQPGQVNVEFDVAALLQPEPTPETEAIRTARLDAKPYWHIERSRIGKSRKVPVEIIVNGQVAAKEEIEADGQTRTMKFAVNIPHSSWVAVRIFPSAHTNPVFIEVGGKPIRASRRSAEWCRQAVDVCWKAKEKLIRAPEKEAAKAAYQAAGTIYERIIQESVAD